MNDRVQKPGVANSDNKCYSYLARMFRCSRQDSQEDANVGIADTPQTMDASAGIEDDNPQAAALLDRTPPPNVNPEIWRNLPSPRSMRNWKTADGMLRCLEHPGGSAAFRDFLEKNHYSNAVIAVLGFVLRVQNYRGAFASTRQASANEIFNTYLSSTAQDQIEINDLTAIRNARTAINAQDFRDDLFDTLVREAISSGDLQNAFRLFLNSDLVDYATGRGQSCVPSERTRMLASE
ncbi:unnamed protein product [Notodromas monacha]|uniref:RGS domain-containing protein n=1 Tax=Notodromas monacha TaxID=399045 RepID=A0A7R9BCX5_9CRUS|nr:unnamed protein product [Notodromas monacha]CAG0912988.1 unnamed protein product [Notodromas monacha]